MSNLSGVTLIGQDLYKESTTRLHKLGALGLDEYGNRFRYAKFGTGVVVGHLLQEPVEDANYRSMVVSANAAIGTRSISVTLGGTAVTAGQFDQGILVCEAATGLGQTFRIVGHTVQTSTTGVCTFTVDRDIKIALVVTTSQVSIRKNPFNGVIDYPTTQTGGCSGVALYTATSGSYGWVQTGGDVAVLFDTGTNTSANATAIGPSAAVAGSVAPVLDAVGAPTIGFAREVVSVDSTYGTVHLMID